METWFCLLHVRFVMNTMSGGGSFLFIKAQAGGAAYHYRAPAQS